MGNENQDAIDEVPSLPVQVSRNIRYSYLLRNDTAKILDNIEVLIMAPLSRTPFQTLKSLKVNEEYRVIEDSYYRHTLDIKVGSLAPFEQREIKVSASVLLTNIEKAFQFENSDAFVMEEVFVEANHPDIQPIAQMLKGETEEETLSAIHDWITAEISKTGFMKASRGALSTLRSKTGDCTEFGYLTSALARYHKIPSSLMGGFKVKGDSVLSARTYHNWNLLFTDGSWQLVDTFDDAFRDEETSYIAFETIAEEGPQSSRQSKVAEGYTLRLQD